MLEVKPLTGTIILPGDKSISHRSAMFSVLAKGKSVIENISSGGDVLSTISVLKQLGADINIEENTLTTNGKGLISLSGENQTLDCGNSGTSLRLFCGFLSGQNLKNITLIGDESLSRRPQDRVVKPLQRMGINISSTNGLTPILLNKSNPDGGRFESIISSGQIKSAILLAGLYAENPVTDIEETFTRDHSENMLRAMGVKVISEKTEFGYEATVFPPVNDLKPLIGLVPSDPSSAVFFGVLAALIPGSDILISNLLGNATRIGWLKVLQRMGAEIEIIEKSKVFNEKVIDVKVKYSELIATDIRGDEISSLIDELPMLSIAMAKAKGISRVRDATELRVKESDRITVVLDHLNRMGVKTTEYDDGYDIVGSTDELNNCYIEPHHDHRIAMTFVAANYLISGVLEIAQKETISTSFPTFYHVFEQVSV